MSSAVFVGIVCSCPVYYGHTLWVYVIHPSLASNWFMCHLPGARVSLKGLHSLPWPQYSKYQSVTLQPTSCGWFLPFCCQAAELLVRALLNAFAILMHWLCTILLVKLTPMRLTRIRGNSMKLTPVEQTKGGSIRRLLSSLKCRKD